MSRSSPRRDQRPTDHQGDENAQAASPCNVQGLVLHDEIHDKRVTDCLEARSAYAPPTDERGCRVECNLIALFRLLVFYGHFLDKHEMYWTYIAQDIGWPRNVAENITSIYVRARFKFLTRVTRRLGTDSAHAQRSSGTLCTVIDQYIELARSHNDRVDRREPPLLLTESREKYIADTRDAFKKMNPTSLVQAAPSPPAPPQNPDWLPASRSRSRSPRVPDAQQNNNAYRQRSPTNGHPPAPKQEPIEQPRGAHAEPAPLDSVTRARASIGTHLSNMAARIWAEREELGERLYHPLVQPTAEERAEVEECMDYTQAMARYFAEKSKTWPRP